ncbi:MAG: GlxA family transcriptional regulator [Pseudomonadota bacterium]
MQRIVFLVFPYSTLLDLTGPLQVFEDANRVLPQTERYRISIVSPSGGAVATDTAMPAQTESADAVRDSSIDTLIVVGGNRAHELSRDPAVSSLVASLAAQANRVAAVCTGAFFLAAAGLLNGRRAVTHWRAADLLAERYPEIRLERDPIFVQDDTIWTSAGVTAGIDLALALVAEDCGRQLALELARELVTFMARPGGQMQFSRALSEQMLDNAGSFDQLLYWIRENLTADLRVDMLAERCNMSARTFARKFTMTFGEPPAKLVEKIRLEAAMALLVESRISLKSIALRCGLIDVERMRRAFRRQLGVSPSDYRARFRSTPDGDVEQNDSQAE